MIKKAVLPVAGLGTRFLPASKATPKEMLPIIDKPLVQYAVEEAIDNIFTTFGTQPHVANNKLQQITWLNQILSLPKAKLDNFATDLVFISKKEGRRYGPFAKIY